MNKLEYFRKYMRLGTILCIKAPAAHLLGPNNPTAPQWIPEGMLPIQAKFLSWAAIIHEELNKVSGPL